MKMEKFKFTETKIKGVYVIEPTVFGDSRGYFVETYNEQDFKAAGLNYTFVQDNQSASTKGVLRGLHFQKKHPQGKLVSVVEGQVFDVAVDLRTSSPTFGNWHGVTLSAEKHNMFYVPEGFAHGFVVISPSATFCYKCTDVYHPEDEDGIRWNDPTVAVKWPELKSEPLLSAKDTASAFFDKNKKYF